MPRIACPCGHSMFIGEIPCPFQWNILADDAVDGLLHGGNKMEIIEFGKAADLMFRCPECGRLLIFWNKSEVPQVYEPAKSDQN